MLLTSELRYCTNQNSKRELTRESILMEKVKTHHDSHKMKWYLLFKSCPFSDIS